MPRMSDPTTAYAKAVLTGEIVAGAWVRGACARHLRDIENAAARGLYWRPEKAEYALNFYPSVLTITAGAAAMQPFNLLPWQVFVTGSLFGWVRENGLLRYRSGWLETGKGQAKSPWMAATGLLKGFFMGIPRAEVYAIAQDKDQANVLFHDAVAMCRAPMPDGNDYASLESTGVVLIRGVGDNAWKIEHPASGSVFKSEANSDAISGPRPVLVMADEVHEAKSDKAIEIWKAALTKMPGDPLMLLGTNTPATSQYVGTALSAYYQAVALGEVQDDTALAYIARVDKNDDPFTDEGCWQKSLPALGITYPLENIRDEVQTAKQLASRAPTVKRLYFGIPTGAAHFWVDEDVWQSRLAAFDETQLKADGCFAALDLSQKNDLTALSVGWLVGQQLFVKTYYWTPRIGIADRARADLAPYDRWADEGYLTAVPGPVIDKTFVAAKVKELVAKHNLSLLAYDPAGMDDFMRACADVDLPVWRFDGADKMAGEGLMLVPHAQGPRVRFEDKQLCMPRSIERLEDRILTGRITIAPSPVTYACAANAAMIEDGAGNRAFDKRRSRGRIDGLVTLAMVAGAAEMPVQQIIEPNIFVL